jgi:hypothetical protein
VFSQVIAQSIADFFIEEGEKTVSAVDEIDFDIYIMYFD